MTEQWDEIVGLLKQLYSMSEVDVVAIQNFLSITKTGVEKEIETRTKQKKGKKELVSQLEALSKFEILFSYLTKLNLCSLEKMISEAEDVGNNLELIKLYSLTEKLHQKTGELLKYQAEATKRFNNKWTSGKLLVKKVKRDELVYSLWKKGLSVTEIKNEVDKKLKEEGETHGIGRQTIYNLIFRYKKIEGKGQGSDGSQTHQNGTESI